MTIKIKPMLASGLKNEADINKIQYPVLVSPKFDGIRCIIHPELGPVSRTLKPIRNNYIRSILEKLQPNINGFDGELICSLSHNLEDSIGTFNETSSGVMSATGNPNFKYWAFDDFTNPNKPYQQRDQVIDDKLPGISYNAPVRRVKQYWVNHKAELLAYEKRFLKQGFEGLMLRAPDGPYKFGRSTLNEGYLIKLKRPASAEAIIIGFAEMCEAVYTKEDGSIMTHTDYDKHPNLTYGEIRQLYNCSKHKDKQILKNTLGALVVRGLAGIEAHNHEFMDVEFELGTGFDDALRQEIWNNKDKYLNKMVTFEYQYEGSINKPRFPVYKRFRADE